MPSHAPTMMSVCISPPPEPPRSPEPTATYDAVSRELIATTRFHFTENVVRASPTRLAHAACVLLERTLASETEANVVRRALVLVVRLVHACGGSERARMHALEYTRVLLASDVFTGAWTRVHEDDTFTRHAAIVCTAFVLARHAPDVYSPAEYARAALELGRVHVDAADLAFNTSRNVGPRSVCSLDFYEPLAAAATVSARERAFASLALLAPVLEEQLAANPLVAAAATVLVGARLHRRADDAERVRALVMRVLAGMHTTVDARTLDALLQRHERLLVLALQRAHAQTLLPTFLEYALESPLERATLYTTLAHRLLCGSGC